MGTIGRNYFDEGMSSAVQYLVEDIISKYPHTVRQAVAEELREGLRGDRVLCACPSCVRIYCGGQQLHVLERLVQNKAGWIKRDTAQRHGRSSGMPPNFQSVVDIARVVEAAVEVINRRGKSA